MYYNQSLTLYKLLDPAVYFIMIVITNLSVTDDNDCSRKTSVSSKQTLKTVCHFIKLSRSAFDFCRTSESTN